MFFESLLQTFVFRFQIVYCFLHLSELGLLFLLVLVLDLNLILQVPIDFYEVVVQTRKLNYAFFNLGLGCFLLNLGCLCFFDFVG